MLELEEFKDIVCDVCGNEALANSREHKHNKKNGLALCSQYLKN